MSFTGGVAPITMFPGIGAVGTSISGSLPLYIADDQFEPNFRHFDFVLGEEPPNQDLVERVWKVEDHEAHWAWRALYGGNLKSIPIVLLTAATSVICNHMHVRVNQRPTGAWRWSIVPFIALTWTYHNAKGFISREKNFSKDFQRNQCYAHDEIKRLRDEVRVKEAIYESRFVHHPVAEYRIKEWQLSKRFN